MRAVYRSCTDGDVYHDWKKVGDEYECSRCHAKKADDNTYVDIADCEYTQSSRYNTRYTGSPVAPKITVKYNGNVLTAGKDYNITFKNNVNVGYATYTVTGIKDAGFNGKAELSYRIIPRKMKYVSVKMKSSHLVYSGKIRKPSLKLSYKGIPLKAGTDYTVSKATAKNVGTGTVEITGKGNFSEKRTVTYRIVPKTPSITKTKALRGKKIYVRWKTKKNQVSGYQVAYSVRKSFKSGKVMKVGKKSVKKTFKVKKAKKKSYVRVRTYKTVKGKKIYSSWSKAKVLKTKR